MFRKTAAKSLADGNNYNSKTVNISAFIQPRKCFISEWCFFKIHEIGSLVVRKVKKSWDSRQNRENRELGPAWRGVKVHLLIPSSCLSPGRVKKLQKCINSVSKLAIVLIWNIKSPHVNNLYSSKRYKIITKLWAQCTFSTSWSPNGKDRSTTVVVLISGAFVQSRLITNGV